MKMLWSVLLLNTPLMAADTIWMKGAGYASGQVEASSQSVTVRWPFGSVTLGTAQLRPPPQAPKEYLSPPLALTRGQFSVSYQLEASSSGLRLTHLKVQLQQHADYFHPPTPLLRGHEAGHQRLNERALQNMRRRLAALRFPHQDLTRAHAHIRSLFDAEVRQVESLHQDWDRSNLVREVFSGSPILRGDVERRNPR